MPMTMRVIASLFGLPGRARTKTDPSPRTGHEMAGQGSDLRHSMLRGAFYVGNPGTSETRLGETLLFGTPVRR